MVSCRYMADKVREHPFRMPLDADDGQGFVGDAFDDAVIGSLDYG